MPQVTTSIDISDSCPQMVIENTTTYPGSSDTHLVSDFNQYATLSVSYPNGEESTWSTIANVAGKYIATPYEDSVAGSIIKYLETCKSGLFTLEYIQLPSPRESESAECDWITDECFYYNGKIYKVLSIIAIPSVLVTNAVAIADGLANGDLVEIQASEIPDNYKSTIEVGFWCGLRKCLMEKLKEFNCKTVGEPTRVDICEDSLYEEILQLWTIYNSFTTRNGTYTPTEQQRDTIVKASNYVNSICCNCKNC